MAMARVFGSSVVFDQLVVTNQRLALLRSRSNLPPRRHPPHGFFVKALLAHGVLLRFLVLFEVIGNEWYYSVDIERTRHRS